MKMPKARRHRLFDRFGDFKMRLTAIFAGLLFVAFISIASGQKPPDKIRGYKVYEANVRVVTAPSVSNDADAWIRIGDPKLVSAGLTGVTFEIGAEIGSPNHSGNVDYLTFSDFHINGVAVEIEEYNHPFSFKKDVAAALPAPARVFVSSTNVARAAYKELVESKKDWAVTGTVYVFGKFKKMGFTFKRVVPVKIDIRIRNPIN